VHGFASVVPEDSIFLSRVGTGHKGNLVPDASGDTMYSIYDRPDPRAPAAIADPFAAVPAQRRAFLNGSAPVEWHAISAAPSGAHGAAMVRLPTGWRSAAQTAGQDLEILTLAGTLACDGIEPDSKSATTYIRVPVGAMIPALSTDGSVRAFIAFGAI
jgi:hypothetical protein